MYIYRDITQELLNSSAYIQVLIGPRQCGKSTLFASFLLNNRKLTDSSLESYHQSQLQEINFDDLQLRQLANRDPALFLQQYKTPLILDEIQYVPNLFPELKKIIDRIKRELTFQTSASYSSSPLFYLTGSNQILMDKTIKESLAGRATYYYLNTLTVHEILQALPHVTLHQILYQGGWPEIYTKTRLNPVTYLNDYIRSYLEKDIVMSAGIQKIAEFHAVLGLLAARTGCLIDYSTIARDSGVRSNTVAEWVSLLERADLVYRLKPYYNNFNKRLIKSPKIYFCDTGLAVRLQGWSDPIPLFNSPQIGALFETLVLNEIIKFIQNYRKDWQLFFWRTKEGEEIDFILQTSGNNIHAFEVKLASQRIPEKVQYPSAFKKQFMPRHPLVIITLNSESLQLSQECRVMPLAKLHDHLMQIE